MKTPGQFSAKLNTDVVRAQQFNACQIVLTAKAFEEPNGGPVPTFQKLDFLGQRTERAGYAILV